MARRPSFDDEPVSRLAAWSGRLSAVRARGGGALDHHRAFRPAGDRAGARDLRRRVDFRRAGGAAGVRGLCRDLAAGPGRARARPARAVSRAAAARLSGLSRLSRQQAAGDLRHHHRSGQSAALRRAGAVCARAGAPPIPAPPPPSASARPIPTSCRCNWRCRRRPPTTSRSRSPPSANGCWSIPARRRPAAARASSRRWRARRSWASATTW